MQTLPKTYLQIPVHLARTRQTIAASCAATMAFLAGYFSVVANRSRIFGTAASRWARLSTVAASRWSHRSALTAYRRSREFARLAAAWARRSARVMAEGARRSAALAADGARRSGVFATGLSRRAAGSVGERVERLSTATTAWARRFRRADDGFVINLDTEDLLPAEDGSMLVYRPSTRSTPPPLPRSSPRRSFFAVREARPIRADEQSVARALDMIAPRLAACPSDVERLVRSSGREASIGVAAFGSGYPASPAELESVMEVQDRELLETAETAETEPPKQATGTDDRV